MPGNDGRRGAVRKRAGGNPTAGSGGRRRRGLEGKGPTPAAKDRVGHVAGKKPGSDKPTGKGQPSGAGKSKGKGQPSGGGKQGGAGKQSGAGKPSGQAGQSNSANRGTPPRGAPVAAAPPGLRKEGPRRDGPRRDGPRRDGPRKRPREAETAEWIVGRNAVVEALRAGVPGEVLRVAERIDRDDRVREAYQLASTAQVPLLETPRTELDKITGGATHQGLGLQVPPYSYAHPDDLVEQAYGVAQEPLLVALDGVTDPQNLGAAVRSAAAFGAHGVVIPERRSAGMTAAAWKASAGAAVRTPVARAVNLTRALKAYQASGLRVVGLTANTRASVRELDWGNHPTVVVVGAEGAGLSRLVRETCDLTAAIPMAPGNESLNAGVAVGVTLYEIAGHGSRARR